MVPRLHIRARISPYRPNLLSLVRFQSSLQPARKTVTGLTKDELKNNEFARQAPNRQAVWSKSQESRLEIIAKYPSRFVQRDLDKQPRPYAAIDLIAQEPIRYLSHAMGSVAVCDGNRESTLQGHPKVFINLDQPKAHTCGYCGLRYAKEEYRELIEKAEALHAASASA